MANASGRRSAGASGGCDARSRSTPSDASITQPQASFPAISAWGE